MSCSPKKATNTNMGAATTAIESESRRTAQNTTDSAMIVRAAAVLTDE